MTVALSRHFENLRTLLSCYSKFVAGNTCTVVPAVPIDDPLKTNEQNSILNMMRTNQAKEIGKNFPLKDVY